MVDASDYASRAEGLLTELGYRLGKPINQVDGVTVLETPSSGRWIIEAPSGTELLFIHSPLTSKAELEAMDGWDLLAQNARLDLLRGAWLALNREKGMLELCAQCPIAFLDDVQMLENMLVHLIDIRGEVIRMIDELRVGQQADEGPKPNCVDGAMTTTHMIGV